MEATFERATDVTITLKTLLGADALPPVALRAEAGTFRHSLDISRLPAGAYVADVTHGAERSARFVVKR